MSLSICRRILFAAALSIAVAGPARADSESEREAKHHERDRHGWARPPKGRIISAPEFDPATAGAIAAILAAGGVVLARRRRR